MRRPGEKWSKGDRIAVTGVVVAVLGVIAAALAIPGMPKIFPWVEESHKPPAPTSNPIQDDDESSKQSLQAPSIDLSPGYVQYGGLTIDYDHDPPIATKTYKVSFTLKNVGLSSAIDTRYAVSCRAFAWQESPSFGRLQRPKSPGLTLTPNSSRDFGEYPSEDYYEHDNRPEPKMMLCDSQVWYQDVRTVAYHKEFCLESKSIPDKKGDQDELALCSLTKLKTQ